MADPKTVAHRWRTRYARQIQAGRAWHQTETTLRRKFDQLSKTLLKAAIYAVEQEKVFEEHEKFYGDLPVREQPRVNLDPRKTSFLDALGITDPEGVLEALDWENLYEGNLRFFEALLQRTQPTTKQEILEYFSTKDAWKDSEFRSWVKDLVQACWERSFWEFVNDYWGSRYRKVFDRSRRASVWDSDLKKVLDDFVQRMEKEKIEYKEYRNPVEMEDYSLQRAVRKLALKHKPKTPEEVIRWVGSREFDRTEGALTALQDVVGECYRSFFERRAERIWKEYQKPLKAQIRQVI